MTRRRKDTRPQRPAAPPGEGWLWGIHPVLAALANPARRCTRLVATAETLESLGPRLAEAAAAGGRGDIASQTATRRDIDALLPEGSVHQGLALKADPLPDVGLEEICARLGDIGAALVVVLDQPNDPHNVGAVLRSAAAFGAAAVVVPERHAPSVGGTLAKAASGALETVPLVRIANLSQALEQLKQAGFWSVGLDGHAPRTLAESPLDGRTALVVGSEGRGLRRLTRERCDHLARIPISGVESLNLSNAAAVALYEWARRRG